MKREHIFAELMECLFYETEGNGTPEVMEDA